ncbi:heat stress transcription factor A-8 isoform X2 [Andrographis paniculata]|uniref:heat stress transcription factor A-8 isoform X2 n=1 Tax=Andrographis paniculata TaxID=175694 RepID=UPI0021E973E1|nr:heat stress transcription factor A-8 isoform X2 [Andrographis paniculata]
MNRVFHPDCSPSTSSTAISPALFGNLTSMKVDTDRWQFANESFIKGQKHLLKNISRRKQPQSVVQKRAPQPKEDPPPAPKEEKQIDLWKEVENLKTDKNALMQELKKLRQHQQTSETKLRVLREQLKGMEKHQQQMLSFIVMAMQRPEFMVQFFQPKETNWRVTENGNTKLSEVTDDADELNPSDRTIVRYQPPPTTNALVPELATEVSKSEDLMELEFSSEELRDLFMDMDLLFGPMDEKRLPLENTQLVLPDLPENDQILEQLLLSDPEMDEMDGQFVDEDDGECQNEAREGTDNLTTTYNSENVEVLTKQMGYLTSEVGL